MRDVAACRIAIDMSAKPTKLPRGDSRDGEVPVSRAHSVPAEATRALRADVAGQVFVPADAGYDQARRAWTLTVDQRPAMVVEAASTTDVAASVRVSLAPPADQDQP